MKVLHPILKGSTVTVEANHLDGVLLMADRFERLRALLFETFSMGQQDALLDNNIGTLQRLPDHVLQDFAVCVATLLNLNIEPEERKGK